VQKREVNHGQEAFALRDVGPLLDAKVTLLTPVMSGARRRSFVDDGTSAHFFA
jgi:hypothetical protein